MAEIVRGVCHWILPDEILGQRTGALFKPRRSAVARNGARRETPPGGSRRGALIAPSDKASKHHIFEKSYRGSRRSTRVACSTPLSSTWPSTITNEPSWTSSCCPGFPSLVHSVELS